MGFLIAKPCGLLPYEKFCSPWVDGLGLGDGSFDFLRSGLYLLSSFGEKSVKYFFLPAGEGIMIA